MGHNLRKYLFVIEGCFDQTRLAEVKQAACILEKEFMVDKKRSVNIDPGYMTEGKVVLASTKDNIQRIYLGQGIYGEVTLYYKKGKFHPFEYTYRDYREGYREFLHACRKKVKELDCRECITTIFPCKI